MNYAKTYFAEHNTQFGSESLLLQDCFTYIENEDYKSVAASLNSRMLNMVGFNKVILNQIINDIGHDGKFIEFKNIDIDKKSSSDFSDPSNSSQELEDLT